MDHEIRFLIFNDMIDFGKKVQSYIKDGPRYWKFVSEHLRNDMPGYKWKLIDNSLKKSIIDLPEFDKYNRRINLHYFIRQCIIIPSENPISDKNFQHIGFYIGQIKAEIRRYDILLQAIYLKFLELDMDKPETYIELI